MPFTAIRTGELGREPSKWGESTFLSLKTSFQDLARGTDIGEGERENLRKHALCSKSLSLSLCFKGDSLPVSSTTQAKK